MDVLITGGSGFLGRALTARLRDDGVGVTWLSRDARKRAPDGVRVRTYESLRPDDAFDAVVNLAGAPIADRRWSTSRRRVLRESRLGPTQSLVDWIQGAATRPRVLLSGSAIGWYGAQGDTALDETSAPHVEFQHALCAEWEACAAQATTFGVPVVLLRTGVVLHPDGGVLARMLLPFRLGLGARLGNGTQVMSWIAREDWVEAARWLLQRHLETAADAPVGAVNLTSPEPVRNGEFTATLARVLHRPAVFAAPSPVLRAALGEMATLLIDGQRVLPKRLVEAGFVFRHPRLEPALRAQLSG